jgi:hypothetical protein
MGSRRGLLVEIEQCDHLTFDVRADVGGDRAHLRVSPADAVDPRWEGQVQAAGAGATQRDPIDR